MNSRQKLAQMLIADSVDVWQRCKEVLERIARDKVRAKDARAMRRAGLGADAYAKGDLTVVLEGTAERMSATDD